MEETTMAANEVGTADQQSVESTEQVTAEVAEKTEEVATPQEDITQTQAFSKRLNEAKQKAIDEEYAQLYGEYGIKSKAEYEKAVEEQKRQQEIIEMVEKNIPQELAQEISEARKFRQQYEAEQKTRAEQAAMHKNYEDFLTAFPDVKPNEIPAEVWQEVNNGTTLTRAYKEYALEKENATLKAKLEAFEKGEAAEKTNQANANSTTGSVTGNGATTEGNISFETFEANKHNQEWVNKNYNKIMESRSKWGG